MQASAHIGACGRVAIMRPHSQATLLRTRKSIKMIEELCNYNSTFFAEKIKRKAKLVTRAMPIAAKMYR